MTAACVSGQDLKPATPSAWKLSANAAVKESFDSNVYLQSESDQANQSSFVTSFLPFVAGSWKPSAAFGASLSYGPEINFFHSESSEDFVLHRALLNLSGKSGQTAWESASSFVCIDGSSVGPTWTAPGGAPATGGPAVRDRRDAAVFRSSLRVKQSLGEWFVRPTVTAYVHDFQTDHRSTPGYQNYVDRNEFTAGGDFGRNVTDQVSVWLGYRYGMQDQSRLLQYSEEYDNQFHRALFGAEGNPSEWLKMAIVLGPEVRRYGPDVAATFEDRDELNLFVDASVSILPGKADTIMFSVKQFEQPGFGGRSTYEDLTYDISWRHKLDERWTLGTGARAYNTDFLLPVVRNDWVFSVNALVNYAFDSHLSLEASYAFEAGLTQDENASGREYERHLVALGVKYVFR